MYPLVDIHGVQGYLESFTTLHARLAASTVLVLLALLTGSIVTPYLVQRGRQTVTDQILTGRGATLASTMGAHVPWTVPVRLAIRALQGVIVILTGGALLVIWQQLAALRVLVAVGAQLVPVLSRMVVTLTLVVGAYVGTQLLENQLTQISSQTSRMTKHQEGVVFRLLQISLFGTVGLLVLSVWQIDLQGLLVSAGFAGIVIGLAARQTLGSLIAGFVLMFSRPFEIGDWVTIGEQEGIVTDISIVNTRLENFDGEYVVIPNDRVSDAVVLNRTRKGRIRLRVEVGVDYTTDPEHAEDVATDALTDVEEIMRVPAPEVVPTGFGDSAILLELRFWIDNPSAGRKWRGTAAVIHAVKAAFDREGIDIPFPQRELMGRTDTGGFRVVHDTDEPNAVSSPPGTEPQTRSR